MRREHKMWMKGRGFRMYPESGNEVNTYYGPKTARYLWNLDSLRGADPSRALVTAIDEALEMARVDKLANRWGTHDSGVWFEIDRPR